MLTDILNLFKQGKGSARSHMKNLIEMAAVDGNFDPVESELLKSIAKRNNISESQLLEIRKNPQGVKFEVPSKKEEKFSQLYDLVHMMSIDKNIHDEEVKLCDLFAVRFGYPREKIKELIESIRFNIENKQTAEEAFKRLTFLINQ
jgi:uncharacterized tellurite resistance protein B-like protein